VTFLVLSILDSTRVITMTVHDGSSIAAEEDMDEQESTSHDSSILTST